MRPVFIRAKGFRSYGNLDLDLSGVRSLLVFGPKGSGKSSILDAMLPANPDPIPTPLCPRPSRRLE